MIEDAYNASPDSMKAALKVLSGMEGRRIAVLADMLELGDKEKEYHEEVGRYLAECGIEELLCTGELSRSLMKGAKEAGKNTVIQHFDNNKMLGDFLKTHLSEGDNVLIKGSNGMKLTEVISILEETR